MMEAVVRKYGEPVGKTMETGKENLDKILKQALEELSVYHWDVATMNTSNWQPSGGATRLRTKKESRCKRKPLPPAWR